MRRIVVGTTVLVGLLCCWAAAAQAAAPDVKGWWTATNPLPAPPDVPADGFLIEGGVGSTNGSANASPTAFAAFVYQLPADATVGPFVLPIAPSSGTVPSVTLELCPLASPSIQPDQGGPMSHAPKFDCTKSVAAAPASNGTSYKFDASSLISGNVLAVAVLPTTPTDRVVLNAPGVDSLAVQEKEPSPVVESPVSEAVTAPALAPSSGSLPIGDIGGAGPAAPSVAAPPSAPVSAPRQNGSAAGTYVPVSSAGEGSKSVALTLLLAGGVVLGAAWLFIGRIAATRTLTVVAATGGGTDA